jgi:serine/threonine-protein kinase RsbW
MRDHLGRRIIERLKAKIRNPKFMRAKHGEVRWTLSIPSNRERIHHVLEETDAWLRKQHFGEQEVHDLTLAVVEATNNAIQHGNQGDPRKKVSLSFSLTPGELVVTVADQGKGFDLREVPRRFPAHPSLADHGRGVLLMRSLVDEVGFEKKKRGLCVRLVKHRAT